MPAYTSKFSARHRKPLRSVGVGIASTAAQADADVPTVTSGTGAPSTTEPNGSLWLRTDGGAATTLYVRVSGSWLAVTAA